MPHRREALLDAAIAIVREGGYPALTQTRVAASAGVSQGHLTYYFPTRADLVQAVAERIVHAQFETFDQQPRPTTRAEALHDILALVTAADRTRAFTTLLLAADTEPVARAAFSELVSGMRLRAAAVLAASAGEAPTPEAIARNAADGRLLHATAVGLAILSLTAGDHVDEREAAQTLSRLLDLLVDPGIPARSNAEAHKRGTE